MSGSSNPINNSSGQYQTMLLANTPWVDAKTGVPTPVFFSLMRAIWIRTGGGSAPAANGNVGLNYVGSQATDALSKAEQALVVGMMALLDEANVPPPDDDTTTGGGGSAGALAVDVVTPPDLGPPPYALAKAWFIGA